MSRRGWNWEPPSIQALNCISEEELYRELDRCCHSQQWVKQVAARRPFSIGTIDEVAKEVWWSLSRKDWLEAFAGHPMIGEKSIREKFGATKAWASQEQAGAQAATEVELKELAIYNDRYMRKFGYVFLVCATGKSAAEMLSLLKSRLPNHPADEIVIAAAEQSKITSIRLQKLLTYALHSKAVVRCHGALPEELTLIVSGSKVLDILPEAQGIAWPVQHLDGLSVTPARSMWKTIEGFDIKAAQLEKETRTTFELGVNKLNLIIECHTEGWTIDQVKRFVREAERADLKADVSILVPLPLSQVEVDRLLDIGVAGFVTCSNANWVYEPLLPPSSTLFIHNLTAGQQETETLRRAIRALKSNRLTSIIIGSTTTSQDDVVRELAVSEGVKSVPLPAQDLSKDKELQRAKIVYRQLGHDPLALAPGADASFVITSMASRDGQTLPEHSIHRGASLGSHKGIVLLSQPSTASHQSQSRL